MAQIVKLIPQVSRAMECSACGAPGTAGCDCGAPYMPAGERAAEAIAANPNKSDRAIAAELGVGLGTVQRARKSTDPHGSVTTRTGKDGVTRVLPQRKPKTEDVMPTQEEADKSFQATLYDHARWIVDEQMSGQTRQRFFAHLKRKYDVKYTQSDAQSRDKGLPA